MQVSKYVKELSESKFNFWRQAVKEIGSSSINSVYQPIYIIPNKSSNSFENDIKSYFDSFLNCFNYIWHNGMIKYPTDAFHARKSFITAVNEATKNVWDHSAILGCCSNPVKCEE